MKKTKTAIIHKESTRGGLKVAEKDAYIPGDQLFQLTDDHKKELRDILLYAMGERIPDRWFFLYLEDRCNMFLRMKAAPLREDHRAAIADAIKSFSESIKHLRKIEDNYMAVSGLREMPDSLHTVTVDGAPQFELEAAITKKAEIARGYLQFLIKTIKQFEEPKISGTIHRPVTQLCIEIARLLYEHFDNVRLTNYTNGFFRRFCEATLEIMGVEFADIKRACRTAIDTVRPSIR